MKLNISGSHKSFFDVFPYVAIENDAIISEAPERITIILEMHISEFDDEEVMQYRHDKLMGFLCDLPANTIVSFYYCKLFFPAYPVLLQNSSIDIVNYMEQNKYDYVRSRLSPEFSCFMSITLPVPEKEKESSIIAKQMMKKEQSGAVKAASSDDDDRIIRYKETQEKLEFAVRGLMSSVEGYICRLDKSQIILFLSKVLNHDYVHGNEFTDIIKSDFNSYVPGFYSRTPGYVHYDNTYHTVLSLRANTKDSKLPTKTSAGMNQIFLHKDIWEIPFVIQHTIRFLDKSVGLKRARRRESMIATREGFARYFRFLEKTPEGLPPEKLKALVHNNIERVESSNEKFLEQHFHVHLWDKSLIALDKKYKTFDATVSSVYKFRRERFNIKGAYFSVFPGNEHVETINSTLASLNVSDFMPIDLPRWPFFVKNNRHEFYYHNEMDSFSRIDFFDDRCDNHNAIVAGGAGSGKSFLEQDKLWQTTKYDPCIAILDFGGEGQGSFLSFVKNLKGTYLEINLNSQFSINPFEGAYYVRFEEDKKGRAIEVPDINGVPNGMKDTLLMGTLERMAKGKKTEPMPDDVRYELNQCIKRYYKEENNNENNTCNLSDFAEKHLKDNAVFTKSDWDLYKGMYEFIGTGQNKGAYANFFRNNYEVQNKDVICFDMAGLKGHDRLKAVLIPSIIDNIMTNILGAAAKLDRKKYIIMDEAWRDLQGGDMAEFMIEMFRTIRKLNGQITIITQSLDDLLSSSMAKALIANTSYFYIIGNKHDPESLRQISVGNKEGTTRLSEFDIYKIVNQKSKRDFYLLSPYYCGQLRLYPTKEFIMLASTNPNDKEVLRRYRTQLGVNYVTPEVIEAAKHDPYFK